MAKEYPRAYSLGESDNTKTDQLTVKLTVPGDVNLDGRVDFNDLTVVAQNLGESLAKGSNVNWSMGDINYDGQVDFNDLTMIAQYFGASLTKAEAQYLPASFVAQWNLALAEVHANSSVVAVPEPASLATIVFFAGGLLFRRRRKSTCTIH